MQEIVNDHVSDCHLDVRNLYQLNFVLSDMVQEHLELCISWNILAILQKVLVEVELSNVVPKVCSRN